MKTHSLDSLSLVFGLIFVAIAAVGLFDQFMVTWLDLRWLVPAGLVAIGLAMVVTSGRRQADRAVAAEATGDGDPERDG